MATSSVSSANSQIINTLNASATTSNSSANSADEIQNRFLTMLVSQLKNQDPLNPADANQMTTQLSQISMVSGIEKLNTSMEKLLGSYSSTQNMQAAAMIGKTVMTAGNGLELGTNGAVGGVNLAGAADKVTVTIKDAAGNVVQTESLGKQSAGVVNFFWDGKDSEGNAKAAGNYTFTVTAANAAGDSVDAAALQAGTVYAVSMTKTGVSLQLSNDKTVTYDDILQIMN
jgi:flagellar basal-body rod modification protein FlgD